MAEKRSRVTEEHVDRIFAESEARIKAAPTPAPEIVIPADQREARPILSDGSDAWARHGVLYPNSPESFPAEELARRQAEKRMALQSMGIQPEDISTAVAPDNTVAPDINAGLLKELEALADAPLEPDLETTRALERVTRERNEARNHIQHKLREELFPYAQRGREAILEGRQAAVPSTALEDGRALLTEGADALGGVLGLEADVLGHGLDLKGDAQIELGVGVDRSLGEANGHGWSRRDPPG